MVEGFWYLGWFGDLGEGGVWLIKINLGRVDFEKRVGGLGEEDVELVLG